MEKTTWKQCCIDRCVVLSFKFELSESILKQLIKHLFHTFWLLFRFISKYGCPISCKITKLYFISNITQLPRGLKIILNSVPLLNYPFNSFQDPHNVLQMCHTSFEFCGTELEICCGFLVLSIFYVQLYFELFPRRDIISFLQEKYFS